MLAALIGSDIVAVGLHLSFLLGGIIVIGTVHVDGGDFPDWFSLLASN